MTVSKPVLDHARWAETAGDVGVVSNAVEPSSGKKDVGYGNAEQPDGPNLNWLLNQAYEWARYVDAVTNPNGHSNEAVVAWYVQNQIIVGGYATIAQDLTVGRGVYLTGQVTDATLVNVNDYNPTGLANAVTLLLSTPSGGGAVVTGLAGGVTGRRLNLINTGANSIAISRENVLSAAANRFKFPAALDPIVLGQDAVVMLEYDGGASRWRVISKVV